MKNERITRETNEPEVKENESRNARGKNKRRPKRGSKRSNESRNSASNSPTWYAASPQLLKDSASISYNTALGLTHHTVELPSKAIPGVCSITVAPIIGHSADNFSAINVASRNIYSWVRHANSGSANYDAPDLMMYLMATDSLYAAYTHLVRAYGTARLYSVYNRYYPSTLLAAMNFDPDTVFNNLNELRTRLNLLAAKIGSLCVPATMPIFQRHAWMFQNIYVDSDNPKAQTYLYVPHGFYKYNEFDGAGQLKYEKWAGYSSPLDIMEYVKKLEDMVQVVLGSEDMGIMSGDILKAYGADKLMKVAMVTDDYLIQPVYNFEVLHQMMNTITVPSGFTIPDITQDTSLNNPAKSGAIIQDFSKVTITVSGYHNNAKQAVALSEMSGPVLLNSITPPTPELNIVATRLMAVPKTARVITDDGPAPKVMFDYSNLASEVPMYVTYFNALDNVMGFDTNTYTAFQVSSKPTSVSEDFTDAEAEMFYKQLAAISAFDNHPRMIASTYGISVDGDDYQDRNCFYDWAYTAEVTPEMLGRMNDTALISLFDVPVIGVYRG